MSWYEKSKEEKAIIVIFKDHNEVFKSVSIASLSLDIPETLIFNAIRKGNKLLSASGTCFADWLEDGVNPFQKVKPSDRSKSLKSYYARKGEK